MSKHKLLKVGQSKYKLDNTSVIVEKIDGEWCYSIDNELTPFAYNTREDAADEGRKHYNRVHGV